MVSSLFISLSFLSKKILKMRSFNSNVQHQYIAPKSVVSQDQFRTSCECSSGPKFRQLPCKTLISTGSCPFGDRCVFVHDRRFVSSLSQPTSRLKNKEDSASDTFYWPATPYETTPSKPTDRNYRTYTVPLPRNDQFQLHDKALYSLWMHFLELCAVSHTAVPQNNRVQDVDDSAHNKYIQRRRLPVFQLLSSSNGQTITRDQFEFAALSPRPQYIERRQEYQELSYAPVKKYVSSPKSIARYSHNPHMEHYHQYQHSPEYVRY